MPDCVPTSVAFSQLPHLKKHMLSIHGKLLNLTQIPFSFDIFNSNQTGQPKPYLCELCKDFYKTKQELIQHTHVCSKKERLSIEDDEIDEKVLFFFLNLNISINLNYVFQDKVLPCNAT